MTKAAQIAGTPSRLEDKKGCASETLRNLLDQSSDKNRNPPYYKCVEGHMVKRGRPKANGQKDGWVFIRSCVALCAFDKARRNGEKYETAISEAILAVHARGMRISRTEVKRLLAARQLENPDQTLLFWEDPPECSNLARATDAGLSATSVNRPRRLAFGFGPCPEYPRHNAHTDGK